MASEGILKEAGTLLRGWCGELVTFCYGRRDRKVWLIGAFYRRFQVEFLKGLIQPLDGARSFYTVPRCTSHAIAKDSKWSMAPRNSGSWRSHSFHFSPTNFH